MSEETNPAAEATPETQNTESQAAPKWDGDFDPARAQKLIENIRGDNTKLKDELATVRAALKEHEDAKKSDSEKLTEEKEALAKELSEIKAQMTTAKVAKEHGIPDELVEFLGSGDEETLTVRAQKLAEKLNPKPADTGSTPEIPGKPKAKLTPGHADSNTDGQLTRDDLKTMSPDDINKALADGRLNSLMNK